MPWHRIHGDRPRFETFREGGAAARLSEYVLLHNEGVCSGDFAALCAMFHRDGEVAFREIEAGPFVGRTEVERAFRDQRPTDELVVSDVHEIDAEIVEASYGWASAPERRKGIIRLESEKGQIRRLVVTRA